MLLTPLVTKLNNFAKLSNAEIAFLNEACLTSTEVKARDDLFLEGEPVGKAYVLVDGWGCCYKMLPNGGRQIINFAVPGDFLGFRSVLFNTSDHSFSAISSCQVCGFDGARIHDIFHNRPRLATAFLWSMSRDEAIVVEHLVNLGRRSALESMAHLLMELLYRLRLVGKFEENSVECPLTQDDLADALGMSSVHVNRVLRILRSRNILTFRGRRIEFHDVGALAAMAGYDPQYLDHPNGALQ